MGLCRSGRRRIARLNWFLRLGLHPDARLAALAVVAAGVVAACPQGQPFIGGKWAAAFPCAALNDGVHAPTFAHMARALALASDTAIAADIPRETDSRARRLIASAMIGLSPIDRAAR